MEEREKRKALKPKKEKPLTTINVSSIMGVPLFISMTLCVH